MAVLNKYVNANVEAGKKAEAAFSEGAKTVTLIETMETAAADDDASVFRFFKSLNPDLIITECEMLSDAITGFTDAEIGFYEPTEAGVLGAAIDIDALMGSTDINAGNARGSERNCLTAVDVADVKKRIWELAGDTQATKRRGYDIALTANTIGSGVGTISLRIVLAQG